MDTSMFVCYSISELNISETKVANLITRLV